MSSVDNQAFSVSFSGRVSYTSAGQLLPSSCPGNELMAEKVKLTDRKLKSLKPAKAGQRYELMDTDRQRFRRSRDRQRQAHVLPAGALSGQ